MFLQFGALVVAGVGFLLVALVMWVRGQRRRSLAFRRWMTLFYVALALCAGFSAVEQLANPRTFDLWEALPLAALLLAVCALVVAGVYAVRETQRGSGMQR
jgi:hypothetical protein